MSQKLSTITPTYHSFAKDQLLTHSDLNEVIDYFEDQDRLSRICLSGVGLICGFKPYLIKNGTILEITQGSGITTDGDLLHFLFDNNGSNGVINEANKIPGKKVIDSIQLSKFRVFDDSDAKYPPFLPAALNGAQIELLELVPSTLSGSAIDASLFGDRTILIYLDCYSKEAGACTAISCDSQGIEQVRVVRVLLVNDEDVPYILENDYLFNNHQRTQEYLDLVDVAVPRVILNLDNTETVTDLSDAYIETLSNMGSDIYDSLELILKKVEGAPTSLIDSIKQALSSVDTTRFQYLYDFAKDMVDSYNELKELFIQEYPICCPDIYPFPKHLLVGKLWEKNLKTGEFTPPAAEDNIHRHDFYKSPILMQGSNAHQQLISILKRMELMANQFTTSTFTSSVSKGSNPIKITPSKLYTELGERSIPFYYDPMYDSNSESELVRLWDFNRSTLRRYNRILGYHQSAVSTIPFVANPLGYNTDAYNFYRIEGHQGRLYSDALDTINTLKDAYSLAFDVKALGINVDTTQTIDLTEYACDFRDLQGLLDSFIDHQNCVFCFATKLLSGFSTTTEGTNYNTATLMGRSRVFVYDFSVNYSTTLTAVRDDVTTSGTSSSAAPSSSTYTSSEKSSSYNLTQDSSTTASTSTSGDSSRSATSGTTDTTAAKTASSAAANYYAVDTASTASACPCPESSVGFNAQLSVEAAANEMIAALADVDLEADLNLVDVNNTVIKCLYNNKSALGYILLDAFKRYAGTNSTTTYNYVKGQLDELTSTGTAANWDADVKQAALYLPAQIVCSAYAASLLLPTELGNLTSQTVSNYSTEISRICTYSRQLKAAIYKIARNDIQPFSNDLFSLLDILVGSLTNMCCAGEYINSLYKQLDARKTEILGRIQLSKFIGQHPGLEHRAGVEPGGTFVLVYAFNQSGSGVVQNNVVIADFALPYLCCSDCAPINFIVPRQYASILFSQNAVCIDPNSAEPIVVQMTVAPEGATVEPREYVSGLYINSDSIAIVPSEFDLSLLSQPIKFKVDGQLVDASIVVSQPKEVSITLSPNVPEGTETDVTTFTFNASQGYVSGDTVSWDFGDGTPEKTGYSVTHTFALPVVDDTAKVTMRITPANGLCPSTASHTISFRPITVKLVQTSFCENAPNYPFTIIPAGANANITGPGVTDDKKYFSPQLAGVGTHHLALDGVEFVSVDVKAAPTANIIATQDNVNKLLILKADVKNNDKMLWTFHDPDTGVERTSPQKSEAQEISVKFGEIGNPGTRVLIKLTAFAVPNSTCKDNAVKTLLFRVPTESTSTPVENNPTA